MKPSGNLWRVLTFFASAMLGAGFDTARAQPYASTLAPTEVTAGFATLNGMVTPREGSTSAWFEWGSSFENRTAPQTFPPGAAVRFLNASIGGLMGGSIYRCRLVASNEAGITRAFPRRFGVGKTVRGWGGNEFGQATVPAGLSNLVAVEGGGRHSVALRSDGRLVVWGDGTWPQITNVPPGLDAVVAIAAGGVHSIALRRDGQVVEWGYDEAPHIPSWSWLSNVVAVSAGSEHSMALRRDGTVAAWRNNNWGQINVPRGLSNVVAIAGGGLHSLVLRNDGSLVTWGDNTYGQLSIPPEATNIVEIAAAGLQSIALRRDGTLLAWGMSGGPQFLGNTNPANFEEIVTGGSYYHALEEGGRLRAWGYYAFGPQLPAPTSVSNILHLGRGLGHTFAISLNSAPMARPVTVAAIDRDTVVKLPGSDPDGDVLQFRIVGPPQRGALYQYSVAGRGAPITAAGTVVLDPEGRVVFVPEADTSGVSYASFGFLLSDGSYDSAPATVSIDVYRAPLASTLQPVVQGTTATLRGLVTPNAFPVSAWFEWGTNGAFNDQTTPMQVLPGAEVIYREELLPRILTGVSYVCRLVVSNHTGLADGGARLFGVARHIVAWGNNFSGQCDVPAALDNVVAVAAGRTHSLVLSSDGTITSWGMHGYVGSVPPATGEFIAVASGDRHSLALRSDGTVQAWGADVYGETHVPAGLSNVVAVACGSTHSAVLLRDGTMVTWGVHFPSGDPARPDLANLVSVACGPDNTTVLRNNGQVTSWGLDWYGPTNVSAGLGPVVGIAPGMIHTVGWTPDGRVVAWGKQTNVPPFVSNIVHVSANLVNLGVRRNGEIIVWGNSSDSYSPPAGVNNVFAAAAGGAHFLALAGNFKPVVYPVTVPTGINQDVVVQLNGFEPEGEPLQFFVKTIPARGRLYQYLAGSPGAVVDLPHTRVQDPGGRLLFSPEPGVSNPDYAQFEYYASDGQVNSEPALVSLQVFGPPSAATLAPAILRTDATFRGMVLATPLSAVAWFEWGPDFNLGLRTEPKLLGPSADVTGFSAPVSNLVAGVIYQCRLVASNAAGLAQGPIRRFGVAKSVRGWGNWLGGVTNTPPGLSSVTALSLGFGHALALKQDGTVAAWGLNNSGELDVPDGLSEVMAVAAGNGFSLALRTNGTVAAWGDNDFRQTSGPAGLSNVVAISAGSSHALALRSDGTVAAWGGGMAATGLPPELRRVVAISAGWNNSFALRADGRLFAWGSSYNGETNVPAGLVDVVEIASGYEHVLALQRNGRLTGWGRNNQAQAIIPTDLPPVATMAAGMNHSLALLEDGTVRGWGQTHPLLQMPPALSNVLAVAAAYHFSSALAMNVAPVVQPRTVRTVSNSERVIQLWGQDPDRDAIRFIIRTPPSPGTLYQWASGTRGELINAADTPVSDPAGRVIFASHDGTGVPYSRFTFTASDGVYESAPGDVTVDIIEEPSVATLHPWIEGNTVTLLGMVTPNANAVNVWFDWGTNNEYQASTSPVLLQPSAGVLTVRTPLTSLVPGVIQQCRVVASNHLGLVSGRPVRFGIGQTVLGFGYGRYGQTNMPAGLSNIVAIAGGDIHSLALRNDGRVFAWGDNYYGQTRVPPALSNVIAVAAGADHNLALRRDGTVVAWGRNTHGQASVPPAASNVVAVAAGLFHSLLLREDGTLLLWGDNRYNQLGMPAGLQNVVEIAAGGLNTLAIRDDGSVAAWGDTEAGETDVPAAVSDGVAVAVGDFHGLALRADGRVFAWGDNYDGQTEVPPGLNEVIDVSAGVIHSLVLQGDGRVVSWGDNSDGQRNLPGRLDGVLAMDAGGYHNLFLTVHPPPPPEPRIHAAGSLPDGALQFEFSSGSATAWQVWASTNLIHWEALGLASEVAPGLFRFIDPNRPIYPSRFYFLQSPVGLPF